MQQDCHLDPAEGAWLRRRAASRGNWRSGDLLAGSVVPWARQEARPKGGVQSVAGHLYLLTALPISRRHAARSAALEWDFAAGQRSRRTKPVVILLDCHMTPSYHRTTRETEMSTTRDFLEGTWEQINRQAGRLAGKWLRVEVLEKSHAPEAEPLQFHATASPEAQSQAILEWGYGHAPRNAHPLSDEAISRDSIYSDEPT